MNDFLCKHKKCIDCEKLPICTKDKNDYDREKLIESNKLLNCPKCGFVTGVTFDNRIMCLDCGHILKEAP